MRITAVLCATALLVTTATAAAQDARLDNIIVTNTRDNLLLYLKTLEGLKQIDVIIRRNDGAFCDPLELRGGRTEISTRIFVETSLYKRREREGMK